MEQTRCELDPDPGNPPPASFDDLPNGCDYTGTGADVTVDGHHTLYVASEDTFGNKEDPVQSTSFKIDKTPPTVSFSDCPPSSAVILGSAPSVHWSASDGTSGLQGASSGSLLLDTSSPGMHSINAPTATDNAGNTSAAVSCSYLVQYNLLGFFSPATNSKWKRGTTVPVKVALANASGTRMPDAEARALASACQITFSATGAQNVTPKCMKYDPSAHQFIYTWKLGIATGAEAISTQVSYPSTTTKTTKSENITITR